jgi:NADPH-dependent curcumin reductase CurA
MSGFNVQYLFPQYAEEFYTTMPGKVAKGEIKYWDEITLGLDKVENAIVSVVNGTNKAKAIVQVADE